MRYDRAGSTPRATGGEGRMNADLAFELEPASRRDDQRGGPVAITLTSDIEEAEGAWRALEAFGVESPGQCYDFVRAWVRCHEMPRDSQVYVVAHAAGRPVALLALEMTRRFGARVLSFAPDSHVGCNAPLIDIDWFGALGGEERRALWAAMLNAVPQADAVFLPAVPDEYQGRFDLFEGVGRKTSCDTLYRSEFSSWAECDATMRNRKHRKRDRQQGQKLDALGEITFGTAQPDDYDDVLATMFRQKAERFAVLGIDDPFTDPQSRAVYREVLDNSPSLKPEIFVLRVDGEIVAVRYGLGHGDRLFALISSMSEDPHMQTGSPGRQEIFRTVQTIFERGYRMLDLGVTISDEKRAWCNREVTVCNLYFPRSARGWLFMQTRRAIDKVKLKVKSEQRLFGFYKRIRGLLPAVLRT